MSCGFFVVSLGFYRFLYGGCPCFPTVFSWFGGFEWFVMVSHGFEWFLSASNGFFPRSSGCFLMVSAGCWSSGGFLGFLTASGCVAMFFGGFLWFLKVAGDFRVPKCFIVFSSGFQWFRTVFS